MNTNSQKLYIAGVLDAFIDGSGTTDQASVVRLLHYRDCLSRSKMTATQFAQHLTKYVSVDPSLQTVTVPFALRFYLDQACGQPPKEAK